MLYFLDGQLRQVGKSLAEADWTPEDLTLLGQAGRDRLIGFRDSLRRGGDIVTAIVEERTELWLHSEQAGSAWVGGRVILAHLTQTGLLASCADLAELEAIKAKGIDFFRKYFRGKCVFGWRGADDDCVPCLCEGGGRVVLSWCRLDGSWRASSPALRRK